MNAVVLDDILHGFTPAERQEWSVYSMEAYDYARYWHQKAGNKYCGKPYSVHLAHVMRTCRKHLDLYKKLFYTRFNKPEKTIYIVAASHDLIKDIPAIDYQFLKAVYNKNIADAVRACTSYSGKTPAEKYPPIYWERLNTNSVAMYVKLMDRLCNIEVSIANNNTGMLQRYRAEHDIFKTELLTELTAPFFYLLDKTLYQNDTH